MKFLKQNKKWLVMKVILKENHFPGGNFPLLKNWKKNNENVMKMVLKEKTCHGEIFNYYEILQKLTQQKGGFEKKQVPKYI